MDFIFVFEQVLNGLGYGLMLFLIAAGLTLVFGIMDTMNLAHGSLYMAGAYIAARVHESSGSFAGAVLLAVLLTVVVAVVLEALIIRHLYRRDHLVQVLATCGDNFLGGDDFDERIMNWLAERCKTEHGIERRSKFMAHIG